MFWKSSGSKILKPKQTKESSGKLVNNNGQNWECKHCTHINNNLDSFCKGCGQYK